jgi:predicted ATPase
VLDTWFSSALWPFATLGWPDETEMVKRHYPNDLLVSGFDILFFWDARMAMQGLHFMNEVPEAPLSPRPRARGRRAEDVEVEGQRGRSAGPDRQVWR